MGSQKGSMALTLCLALAVAGFFGGIYFFYSSTGGQQSDAADAQLAFSDLQFRVERAMESHEVLNASVARNPNAFACLYTVSAECAGKGGPFQLYEGHKSQPLSQLARSAGLTLSGMGCQSFPSQACPLRVEANWEPVCSSGSRCEGARSAKIQVRVLLQFEGESPLRWDQEKAFTPSLVLSESVVCERGGGVWALTECLSPGQAAERQIASDERNEREDHYRQRDQNERPDQPEVELFCPAQLEIQGEYFSLERVAVNRAVARVPAMNGCPTEDVFTFECQGRAPSDREGQWIQVEAQMAPQCDGNGNPILRSIRQ